MKTPWPEIAGILFLHLGIFTANAQSLSIRAAANKTTQITWASGITDLVLEETSALGPSALWRPVAQPPVLANNQYSVTVDASGGARFFRLHSGALEILTTIRETSPADGETGVAVTRETIVHFSLPLADTTVLATNNFYATFGGRRILSRIELAADRRKATLFYLEPLPGGARVNVFFDAEGVKDSLGRPLDPAGTGQANGFKLIQFDTLSLTPLAATAVIGRVFASELVPGSDTGANAVNKPLAGVTITVDGMEQSLRAVTDAQGNFTLSPVPPGRFFVHIDGRTVTDAGAAIHYPDKSYYPSVGKAWDAVAGRTNNLAGGTGNIFLPLIKVGTLQPVSMAQDTTISFPSNITADNPALAGVSITVPANSLFSDDGTRGGKVGIAPVPPDRLPGPLPPGLELPIVITVQTDGPLNFDRPAPVCFPNLPDPVLGAPLPAGSKQALISFNHKKGIWEAVGSMTVSADGKLICTDPGVGILQPGWHGVAPEPAEPPDCQDVCCPEEEGKEEGPSLASSMARGDPGSGRVQKMKPPKPPPANCKKKKCKSLTGFYKCNDKCADDRRICVEGTYKAMRACQRLASRARECNPYLWEPGDEREEAALRCKRRYVFCNVLNKEHLFLCTEDAEKCYAKCEEDCPPGSTEVSRSTAMAGPDDDLIDSQIAKRFDEVAALLLPYLSSEADIPSEVFTRISELLTEADAIAGGDAVRFLDDHILRLEQELATIEAEFGEEPGNAPPYPVLYMAEIARGTNSLTLRGETGPFGQYSLFVPRDGELLHVSFYDPRTKRIGNAFPRLQPGAPNRMRRFNLHPLDETFLDSDRDGLADLVEFVYGTDSIDADSDRDGIADGAEVEQGTNPLDGLAVQTGIIATAKTPGPAVDVWAGNDLVVTAAEGTGGVSVFNAYQGMNPTVVAHLATPGSAQRVAGTGNFIAVAASDAGLVIIDISTPAEAQVIHQVPMTGAQAVAASAGTVYVGLGSGWILAVDPSSGIVTDRLRVTDAVRDLFVSGETLYALTLDRLLAISLNPGALAVAGSVATQGLGTTHRMFIGGGIAYIVHAPGYNTFDLADPAQPVLLGMGNTRQFGWRQIVPNGAGLGLAVVGPNDVLNSRHDLSLYDVSDPRKNDVFLTQFVTPGTARAVTIFNALAYVADASAGLQVINYLPYDAKGVPPTIGLATSARGGVAEASRMLRALANATDDVQVRNVEFYLDGQRTFSDGNFPFEYWFIPPSPTTAKTNITLRARAIDTGGNATWSDEVILKLGPDTTGPRIVDRAPLEGGRTLSHLQVVFSEPIAAASVNEASFRLISAGPDGQLDTADDVPVGGGVVSYQPDLWTASLDFPAPLPEGLYRAVVTTAVTDVSGNHLIRDTAWPFRVADAVFWINSIDGAWEDPVNWSGGTVPGAEDDVVIDVAAEDVIVTLARGNHRIKSLIANERLILTGDRELEVPGGIQLGQNLTLNNGTIKNTSVTQSGGGRLFFVNNRNTLDGVSVTGDLELTNTSVRVLIRNGLTLTGSVRLDNAGAITFAGDQTFNTGQIIFAGNSGVLGIEPGTTLTLGPAMVVRGKSGYIGQGVLVFSGNRKLINQGVISADVAGGTVTIRPSQFENSGTLECKNGGSATISEGEWSNLGTITVNEATVNLGSTFTPADIGTFNRSGGTVNLTGTLDLGGGMLTLNAATGSWTLNGGTIKGGTVTQNGEAKLIFTNRGATFDGVSVNGDLELTSLGARLLIRNGLTLTGNVLLDNGSALGFAGDQTFNTGTVVFVGNSGSPGWLSIEGNTTLTLGPAVVVRGKTGRIGLGLFLPRGTNKLINQGLISADVAGGALTVGLDQFENIGTIAATATGSTITIRANPFTDTGAIQELNGGKVLINP